MSRSQEKSNLAESERRTYQNIVIALASMLIITVIVLSIVLVAFQAELDQSKRAQDRLSVSQQAVSCYSQASATFAGGIVDLLEANEAKDLPNEQVALTELHNVKHQFELCKQEITPA